MPEQTLLRTELPATRVSGVDHAQPRRNAAPSLADVIFLVLAVFLPLGAHKSLLNSDGDLARHLRLGEWMLQERMLLQVDNFSFTKAGEAFLAFEWGSGVAYALVHRLGGLPAVALFAGLLIAITYALLVVFLRRRGVDPALAVLSAVAAALLGTGHFLARPHLFTFVGAVLLLFLLEPQGRRRVWLFAPLFVVWANLHGGFFYGLVIIGIYLAGSVAELLAGSDRQTWKANARYYAQALGVSTLACLINPFGFGLLAHVADFVGGQSFIKSNTEEFFSPNFSEGWPQVFLVVLLLMITGLILSRQRPSFPRLLAFLACIVFALVYQRNIALFGLTALPLIVLHLDPFWRGLRVRGLNWVRRVLAEGDGSGALGPWSAAAALGLVLLALSGGVVRGATVIPPGFDAAAFPVEAVERARAAQLEGRIFNEFGWGGYLLYAWPEQKVFIDGGTDFYGTEISQAYMEVSALAPGWREALERWGIALVLLPPTSALAHELSREPGWSIWHCDQTAVLLRRTGEPTVFEPRVVGENRGKCLLSNPRSVLGALRF
jgi:hypothetical protein